MNAGNPVQIDLFGVSATRRTRRAVPETVSDVLGRLTVRTWLG
jgi:hypothetical protein